VPYRQEEEDSDARKTFHLRAEDFQAEITVQHTLKIQSVFQTSIIFNPQQDGIDLLVHATTLVKTMDSYKDLSAVLRPDGKLLPEEKEQRKKLGLCLCHGVKDDCPPPGSDKTSTPKTAKPTSTPNMPKPKGRAAQAKNASEISESKLAASTNALDF